MTHHLARKAAQATIDCGQLTPGAQCLDRLRGFETEEFIEVLRAVRDPFEELGLWVMGKQ